MVYKVYQKKKMKFGFVAISGMLTPKVLLLLILTTCLTQNMSKMMWLPTWTNFDVGSFPIPTQIAPKSFFISHSRSKQRNCTIYIYIHTPYLSLKSNCHARRTILRGNKGKQTYVNLNAQVLCSLHQGTIVRAWLEPKSKNIVTILSIKN